MEAHTPSRFGEPDLPRTKHSMPPVSAPFILGWEEWVTLPELGLPAIKAKVDTGARTSALHAFYVEPFGPARARKVRFGVHPVPRRNDIEVECVARLVDRREVRSSNGEREQRYVIETPIRIGDREWPIEVTLANRDMMSYRMLLGRRAIAGDVLVDPVLVVPAAQAALQDLRTGALILLGVPRHLMSSEPQSMPVIPGFVPG